MNPRSSSVSAARPSLCSFFSRSSIPLSSPSRCSVSCFRRPFAPRRSQRRHQRRAPFLVRFLQLFALPLLSPPALLYLLLRALLRPPLQPAPPPRLLRLRRRRRRGLVPLQARVAL